MTVTVLHNLASLNLGGAESRIMDIFRRLDRNRVNFHFVIYEDAEQYYEREVINLGGRVHRVTNPRDNLVRHCYEISLLLRKNTYEVVHSHTSHHSGLIALIAALHGVPTRIAHGRTTGSMTSVGLKGAVSRFAGQQLIAKFATHKVAISTEAGRFVFGERADFRILPNAFDISHYGTVESASRLRSTLGLPINRMIIGQVGRLVSVKNQKFSLRLLKDLHVRHPGAVLVFVGEGSQRRSLETLAAEEGLSDYVMFAGRQDNVPLWLTAFDVVLMPSHYEGLGGAVLEAQAAGTPVVASTGVPRATDIGLSLVSYLPLDAEKDIWVSSVLEASVQQRLPRKKLEAAFSERNFTLEAALAEHERLYGVLKDTSSQGKQN